MSRKIKVHYYSVSSNIQNTNLDSLLTTLSSMTLAQRELVVGHGTVKLEVVEKTGTNWFLHLTAARITNWPGVGQAGQASDDLNLSANSELTENTFAAYDTNTGVLVLQYTQSAVRAGRLFAYFDRHTNQPNSFYHAPILNSDALQRYQQKQVFTEVDAVIDNVTAADVAYFNGSSISAAVRESVQAGVTRMALTFKVDARVQGNQITTGFVQNLVTRLTGRPSRSEADKLVVSGRDAAYSPLEAVDLLADVKTRWYDENAVGLTPGKRYQIDGMKRVLFDALRN